jgi:dTDP-4-dehydrorhamnose reductase
MSRFLIIGGSGFIGGHCLRKLQSSTDTEVLGTGSRPEHGGLIKFDLASDSITNCLPAAWREPGGPKWAVLCAAVSPIDRCALDPGFARSIMVDRSKRCVDELANLEFRTVFLSTSYVFGDEPRGFREDDAPAPMNQYGFLKREMELYLLAAHPSALIARLGKAIGDLPDDRHLLSDWHRLATNRQPIVCIQDQVLCPTLVSDVVAVIEQACRSGLHGVYHVANPEPTRRDVLAAKFLRVCRLETEIRSLTAEQLGLHEPRPLFSWLKSDKIIRDCGAQFTSVEEILERYRRNMLRNPWDSL